MSNHVHIILTPTDEDGLRRAFDEALSYAALRKAEGTGRPVGSAQWPAEMEARSGLALVPQKRGPKPRETAVPCPF